MKQFIASFLDDRNERRVVIGFFVCLFLAGLVSFRHFGVAVDMGTMDSLGRDAYDYVFRGAEWPTNRAWRYHGTAVELPLQIAQNMAAAPDDPAGIYKRVFTQHILVFLLGFAGVAALYQLAKKHFGDWRWALVPCLMYVLTPRFFAQSFYNSRDIPEVAFFTISMLTLVLLTERRTFPMAIAHGVATALALALRMPSLIIVILSLFFFLLDAAQRHLEGRPPEIKRPALLFAAYVATAGVMTICFWPFLWSDPVGHFLEAYRFMSSLGSGAEILGQTYAATPWHYIPLWILVTVPLAYTVFFLYGAVSLAARLARRPFRTIALEKREILFAAWFLLPIISIVATGAGIYNEWRHVFFIYPAFLLIAATGVRRLATKLQTASSPLRWLPQAVIALQLAVTGLWMAANHPMQFAYFSLPKAAVESILTNERVDYWGLSYREAMRYVLAREEGVISVYSPENIAYQNAYNVFPDSPGRLMRVPSADEAMYVLVPSPDMAAGLPPLKEIRIDGHYLSGVYQGPVKEVIIDRATGNVNFVK